MKTNFHLKKLTLLFLLLFIISSCKDDKSKSEIPEFKTSETKEANKVVTVSPENVISPFRIDKVNHNDLVIKGYKNNIHIVGRRGESSFNSVNKTITVKAPLHQNNFTHLKTFDISSGNNKAILYVITNNTPDEILDQNMEYLSNHTFSYNDVENLYGGTNFILKKDEKLFVAVLNDEFNLYSRVNRKKIIDEFKEEYKLSRTIDCKKYKSTILDDEPKEACGGVIVDL